MKIAMRYAFVGAMSLVLTACGGGGGGGVTGGGGGGGGGVTGGGGTGTDTYVQIAALAGSTQGSNISGPLTQDSAGNLYGVSAYGGSLNKGTVFKISTAGVVSTLYTFTGALTDGQNPSGRVFLDASGNIYGHTSAGIFRLSSASAIDFVSVGNLAPLSEGFTCDSNMTWCYFWGGYGTVYRFAVSNGTFASFTSLPSTSVPYVMDMQFGPDGNIYATDLDSVYKISINTPAYSVLHTFSGSASAGGWSVTRGLAFDSSGNVYGTTSNGGTNNNGVIFKLSATGVETKIFDFPASSGSANGIQPQNGVVRDGAGTLFGMALGGNVTAAVLYKINSAGTYSVIHSFTKTQIGTYPMMPLTYTASSGNFYGVGQTGGSSSQGAVFRFN